MRRLLPSSCYIMTKHPHPINILLSSRVQKQPFVHLNFYLNMLIKTLLSSVLLTNNNKNSSEKGSNLNF